MDCSKLTSSEDIKKILKRNFRKIKDAKRLTQEELGQILDVSGKATISNYLNPDHSSTPDSAAVYRLAQFYQIPLNSLYSVNFDPFNSFELMGANIAEYNKFLGVYSLYYLKTSLPTDETEQYCDDNKLSYGVLAIVNDSEEKVARNAYSAYAYFPFKCEEQANQLKADVEDAFKNRDYTTVRSLFTSLDRFCEGDFELIQNEGHYAVVMTGYSKSSDQRQISVSDKITMMGFNPNNTGTPPYIGGATFVSSLSRGEDKCPCANFIIAARPTLFDENQEIHQQLLKLRQESVSITATRSIMNRYHELEGSNHCQADKDILLTHHINHSILQDLEHNRLQILYLLKEKDRDIYKFLKQYDRND